MNTLSKWYMLIQKVWIRIRTIMTPRSSASSWRRSSAVDSMRPPDAACANSNMGNHSRETDGWAVCVCVCVRERERESVCV